MPDWSGKECTTVHVEKWFSMEQREAVAQGCHRNDCRASGGIANEILPKLRFERPVQNVPASRHSSPVHIVTKQAASPRAQMR